MFCWFYKFMISHTQDVKSGPSRIAEKHIRRCVPCRRFHEACLSLDRQLTREAAISNGIISSRLSERILKTITNRRIQTHKVRPRLWIAAAAACLALIFLIGALLLVVQRNARDKTQSDLTQMNIAIQELRAAYTQVGKDIPKTWPPVIERPLATELKNLTSDTESAVRFLVACVAVDIDNTKSKSLN